MEMTREEKYAWSYGFDAYDEFRPVTDNPYDPVSERELFEAYREHLAAERKRLQTLK